MTCGCSRVAKIIHGNRDRGASQSCLAVYQHDGIELFQFGVMKTDVIDHLAAGRIERHYDDSGDIHHSARRVLLKLKQVADFLRVLAFHLLEQAFGCLRWKIGEQVGRFVGRHFLDDVRGFAGIEFLHHLGLQAAVEFGDGVRGFLVR